MRKLTTNELNRVSLDQYQSIIKLPVVIVLDNIRSQNNIGSIFRTADAFLIQEIHLCGITATPPHREIHKTALGATDSVTWKYYADSVDSVKELKMNGFTLYGVEQTDQSLSLEQFSITTSAKIALVFGNEVEGIEERIIQLVDNCIEIPQFGTKHSLNVSVAAGIIIWEVFKKMAANLR
ncbi:MAG: RNA methyltransferase [Bacteroidota bacterium]